MQIDELILSLGFASSGQDEFNLDLYAFDGTSPVGPVLASSDLSVSGIDAFAFQDFSFNKAALGLVGSYDLMANTAYALVLSTDIGSISFEDNDMPPNAYVFGEGFTTAGSGYYISSDSGSNWNPLPYTPIMKMSVSSPANPAAVPGPLPIFGAAAALGYSRKLRTRIKASKVFLASASD